MVNGGSIPSLRDSACALLDEMFSRSESLVSPDNLHLQYYGIEENIARLESHLAEMG